MNTQHWWQQAVFYEIYPRSFADGNGDGIGDLAGLTARLDYLRDLGIDAIWLAPHWASIFGGSAWTLDRRTGQYHYHAFLKEQLELNWRNPALPAGGTTRRCRPATTAP